MKRMTILLCALCLTLTLPYLTGNASAAETTIRYKNAKTLALGDTKIAGGYGYNGFVDNPALLSRVKVFRFSLVNLPITLNDNLIDIGNFINDNSENFENYGDLSIDDKMKFIDEMTKHDGKWGSLRLAPMVDIAVNISDYSIGLAVFNTTDVNVKMDRGIYEPRVWGEGYSNIAYVLGISKPLTFLYPGLTAGVNLKYLERSRARLFQVPASDLGNIEDTMDPILDEVSNSHKTFAIDLGMLWEVPLIDSDVGATLQSIGDGRGSSLDFGISKRMYDDHLTLLADYRDFYDNNMENVFKKVHVGAQYGIGPLNLRVGISSGYPAYGLGLDFKVIDIDVASYSDELTKAPGGNEERQTVAQFKIGW